MEVLVTDTTTKDMLGRHLKTIALNAEAVRGAISELAGLLPRSDDARDGTLSEWEMDEVTMTLEIGAEGGVSLVGTATMAVTGGIEVTFRRPA